MTKIEKRLSEFAGHMNKGLESLNLACKVYADTIREMPESITAFHAKFDFITETTWDKMRLVGDGLINVKVLILTDRQGAKVAKLPIAKQKLLLEKPFDIVENGNNGKRVIVQKKITQMTNHEFNKAVSADFKQVELEKQMPTRPAKQIKPVYEIIGRILVIHRPTRFTLANLRDIVGKMEGGKK